MRPDLANGYRRAGERKCQPLRGGKLDHFGWVANWKPIEIFLYDWWPLARRRDLYRRLAAARVEVRAALSSGSATGP